MRKEIGQKAIYGETGSQQFRNMTFFREAMKDRQILQLAGETLEHT